MNEKPPQPSDHPHSENIAVQRDAGSSNRSRRRRRPSNPKQRPAEPQQTAPKPASESGGGENRSRRGRRRRGGRRRQQGSEPLLEQDSTEKATAEQRVTGPRNAGPRNAGPRNAGQGVTEQRIIGPRVDADDDTDLSPHATGHSPLFECDSGLNADIDGEHLFTAEHLEKFDAPDAGTLRNIAGVCFGSTPLCEFDGGELRLAKGDRVVVESDRGLTNGYVVTPSTRRVHTRKQVPRIVRRNERDEGYNTGHVKSKRLEAISICKREIRKHKLPIKVSDVDYLNNESKAVFYFSAESRIDFRDLVKQLGRLLHIRVEMRQIGVRDGSRLSGGLGPCGRELCCSSWIKDFQQVSIRMAKDQNLVLTPGKISGMCGRLKCCLAYEQSLYHENRRGMPKVNQRVETPAGDAIVYDIDIPRRLVHVRRPDGGVHTFPANLVDLIGAKTEGGSRSDRAGRDDTRESGRRSPEDG